MGGMKVSDRLARTQPRAPVEEFPTSARWTPFCNAITLSAPSPTCSGRKKHGASEKRSRENLLDPLCIVEGLSWLGSRWGPPHAKGKGGCKKRNVACTQ